MSGILDEFFVSLGIKGQDAVLSTIDKVRKDVTNLSKVDSTINIGKGKILKAISSGNISNTKINSQSIDNPAQEKEDNKQKDSINKFVKGLNKFSGILYGAKTSLGSLKNNGVIPKNPMSPDKNGQPPTGTPPVNPADKPEDKKKEEDANKKFVKSVNGFAGGVKNFVTSAADLNPTAVIQGQVKAVGDALGDALSGISVAGFSLGNVPKAVAEMGNAMFGMATGAIDMAKQSAATQWGLQQRNSTVKNYGGGEVNSEADKLGVSRNEYAGLMMKVASSNGQLSGELKSMVTELAKTKDTEQLGNVASGNFASLGTNKGWMMQKIMDSMGDVPPELRQKMTVGLLKQSQGDIMSNEGQGAQGEAAKWSAKTEDQNNEIYKLSVGNTGVESLQNSLNEFQKTLFKTGVGAADAIDNMSKSISSMPEKIKKAGEALEWMSNKIYTMSLHSVDVRGHK